MIFQLLGSLGLFLLGMWLMTEGLKLAGGQALETLLGSWTSSRQRGLAAGTLITALVQSSSAVTVATIGFVNAGLLNFQRALWVVFGSNVGTTFTAWIITFFGFSMNIEAFAFPLVGLGAILRIFSPYERGKAFGMALAGFGLLFMGIDALKENFSSYAHLINIEDLLQNSGNATLLALGLGFVLTLLTQSSSAAITIILTAVASGVAGVEIAAAAVIGANVGTTSTALLSSIGATPNAKRLAWAHVIFNVITAAMAIALLPLFWKFVSFVAEAANMEGNLILLLALFHTAFNCLGILIIWPIEPYLSKWLLSLYRKKERLSTTTSHLDKNAASIPDIAIRTMAVELKELLDRVSDLTFTTNNLPSSTAGDIEQIVSRLDGINNFIAKAMVSNLTKNQSEDLSLGLSSTHHLHNACHTFLDTLDKLKETLSHNQAVPAPLQQWILQANEFKHRLLHSDNVAIQEDFAELLNHYKTVKTQMLEAAVAEKLSINMVDSALLAASFSRRYLEQLKQANEAYQQLVVDESDSIPDSLLNTTDTANIN